MRYFSALGAMALLAVVGATGAGHAQEGSFLGKTADDWLTRLEAKNDIKMRRNAVFALGKIGPQASVAVDALLGCLEDKDAALREAAAFALGEIHPTGAGQAVWLPLCNAITTDDAPLVRRSAAVALGHIGVADALVLKALSIAYDDAGRRTAELKVTAEADQWTAVKQNIAWALGRICKAPPEIPGKIVVAPDTSKPYGDAAAAILRKAIKDDDATVRRDAAGSLQLISVESAQTAIEEVAACASRRTAKETNGKGLDLQNLEARKAAMQTLVRLIGPKDQWAADMLAAILKDKKAHDPDLWRNAALALGHVGGARAAPAIPVLLDLFRSSDRDLRRNVLASMKNLGPDAVAILPVLKRALYDSDVRIREFAAVAMGGFADKANELAEANKAAETAQLHALVDSLVPDLVNVLGDKKQPEEVRSAAAVALSRMALPQLGAGPLAIDAVPKLLKVVLDAGNAPKIRERTLWALRVHGSGLIGFQNVEQSLVSVVKELRTPMNRMLRYDAAYLLGMLKGAEVPESAIPIFVEYLKDEQMSIYVGTTASGAGSGTESGSGKASVTERGKDDGRLMAIQALERIGRERLRGHPAIHQQLRVLVNSQKTLPSLRAEAGKLLEQIK